MASLMLKTHFHHPLILTRAPSASYFPPSTPSPHLFTVNLVRRATYNSSLCSNILLGNFSHPSTPLSVKCSQSFSKVCSCSVCVFWCTCIIYTYMYMYTCFNVNNVYLFKCNRTKIHTLVFFFFSRITQIEAMENRFTTSQASIYVNCLNLYKL